MEFFHKATNFPFMATRKLWYSLSVILMVVSFASFFMKGLNLAIDFTGGLSIEASFPQAANLDAIRSGLEHAGFKEPSVQSFGSSRDVAIRLPADPSMSGEQLRQKVETTLRELDPAVSMQQPVFVGPQVGDELRNSAIWSLSITLLLVFVYVASRFHTWRLSLGAILAVLHDPILVLGIFSITQTTFDLAVVAAILAVVGYSLNDTIIVFDRIRERFEANRRLAPAMALDQSINQTLSRTIMTKLVTLIVVVALLFLGGPVLRGFSEALLIGILAGTYSSIYISASVALDCGLKAEHVFPVVSKKAVDGLP
ncbi:MAG: protein-export rane protein SecF [Pseudomonadota bacterium]|jgi:preprotein translocase subunit SecF